MPMSEENATRFSIGYALAPKKVETVIQPPLVAHAKSRGIDLIPIDTTKPLIEQGPFDCVLHKLYEEEWKHQLTVFSVKNPSVAIIDQPDAIERLHNRVSMLEVVDELPLITDSGNGNTLGIPKQVVIYDSQTLSDPSTLRDLKFPAIAKPLVANGKDESHNMSLVFNKDGMVGLRPPIVLQEFVNHGGVIFKVYVAGEHVRCVKRRSLPDISEEKLKTLVGMLPFSQISNNAIQDQGNDISKMHIEQAEIPPLNFIHDMANGLRQALKLNLFNFDMIRDVRSENRYLVIDINYFPGYAKVPSYENMLTDFFWDIVTKKQSEEMNSELKES